jgi:hypothetical protein
VGARHTCRGSYRACHQPCATGDAPRTRTRAVRDIAAPRYDVVDPTKQHLDRELEAQWNAVLERVAQLEDRDPALASKIDRVALMQPQPADWSVPTTTPITNNDSPES